MYSYYVITQTIDGITIFTSPTDELSRSHGYTPLLSDA